MRLIRLALGVLATAALFGTTGCGAQRRTEPVGQVQSRDPGCVVPANEDALLDQYAGDAVIAFVPDGASGVGSVTRSRGCIRLNKEDVSDTSVTLRLTLSHDYDESGLRQAYDPVASGHGWSPDLARQEQLSRLGGSAFLAYCRYVRGMTTQLSVLVGASTRVDVRPSNASRPVSPIWQETPGSIIVTVAAAPLRSSCNTAVAYGSAR